MCIRDRIGSRVARRFVWKSASGRPCPMFGHLRSGQLSQRGHRQGETRQRRVGPLRRDLDRRNAGDERCS
eukprot:4220337-Prymnesium_polylepis.1